MKTFLKIILIIGLFKGAKLVKIAAKDPKLFIGSVFFFAVIIVTMTLVAYLLRKNFRFSFTGSTLMFEQGIVSKQQKMLSYGAVRSVKVLQGWFDRMFRIGTLVIEFDPLYQNTLRGFAPKNHYFESFGMKKNKVVIPGLDIGHALMLWGFMQSKSALRNS